MAFVSVPKDLTKVKNKIIFNLTKRQLICFGIAAAVGLPFYFLSRGIIGSSNAATGMKFSSKEASARVEKLLRSAIANWEQKNERKAESGELFVTKIYVDGGATLKRMRPAPQGRGYRIRKRSNHVTLFVDSKSTNDNQN